MKDRVRKTLKRMKHRKAVGQNDMQMEALNCLGGMAVEWLSRLFNKVLECERMPVAF